MESGLLKSAKGAGVVAVIKDSTTAGFAKDVIEASRTALVLVDFWAAWCGPCKQLTPVLEKVVKSYGGKVQLVKINADEHPAISGQLRVQSLPTVYAFRDGRPLDGFQGVQPESTIRAFIDRLMTDDSQADVAAVLAAGEEALDAGDLQGAAEAYAAVLQDDQQNIAALTGLARCYLKSGDIARAQQMIGLVTPDDRENALVKSVEAALELAVLASKPDERRALQARLDADPADHAVRLDLAIAMAARGEKAQALDHLLEIVRRNRKWNDDAARKQLVQLFDAWGPNDPLTGEGRRRLSSLLFS
ncbi:MAG: thioredoxin [Hyphomicrobium sp.]